MKNPEAAKPIHPFKLLSAVFPHGFGLIALPLLVSARHIHGFKLLHDHAGHMRGHETGLKVNQPGRAVRAHDDVAAAPQIEMHDAPFMHLADKGLKFFKKLGRNAPGRSFIERPPLDVFNRQHARPHAHDMLGDSADALQPSDGNNFVRNQDGGNQISHEP